MNILALDTCFGACSVAVGIGLGGDTPKTAEFFEPMTTGHAERLIPLIGEALAAANLGMGDIGRIAVTHGPGTFTGTRICVAAARALALSGQIPVVSFSSLDVLANHPMIDNSSGNRGLLAAMNANRGEAYVQHFDGVTRRPKSQPLLLSFGDAAKLGGGSPMLVVGSAGEAIAAAAASGCELTAAYPAILPRIGDILFRAAEGPPLATLPRPLYLRPPDAKPQDGKSLPRALL
jgi:tRNA threonylcarbamoyladenosine biosynthesis protein TsaB